jgi:hypothetical protein
VFVVVSFVVWLGVQRYVECQVFVVCWDAVVFACCCFWFCCVCVCLCLSPLLSFCIVSPLCILFDGVRVCFVVCVVCVGVCSVCVLCVWFRLVLFLMFDV